MNNTSDKGREERIALLRDYVSRLSRKEALEDVRKDFVSHFADVDAAEIADAEQQLIAGGTPVRDVQRLCDVHSALFHGATRQERIAQAEKAVREAAPAAAPAAAPRREKGHPLGVFEAENELISAAIDGMESGGHTGNSALPEPDALNVLNVHYAEKGDLLYPLLRAKYGVSGPAEVMWGVDDEIRDELKAIASAGDDTVALAERYGKVLARAREMIYKEKNILFPLCERFFTQEDWMRIYYELSDYDDVIPGGRQVWEAAESRRAELSGGSTTARAGTDATGTIALGSGGMTPAQIEAVLNTIPMELTFIDERNINRFFNAGPGKKLFKRPDDAIGREVFGCHPPKFAAMAAQVIDELRSGQKDSVDVWLVKKGGPVSVRYMAVRDRSGNYLGTLECVQKMGFAAGHLRG